MTFTPSARRIAAIVALFAAGLFVATRLLIVPANSAGAQVHLVAGTVLDGNAAPAFDLRDQRGDRVSLARLAGRPVVLTFLDATCTTECPVTARYLDRTAQALGARAGQITWLALSVNPQNTRAQALAFVRTNRVTVPLHVLLGAQRDLAPLWRAYHILVRPSKTGDVEHTIITYLVDRQGKERELLDQAYDPGQAAQDLAALLAV